MVCTARQMAWNRCLPTRIRLVRRYFGAPPPCLKRAVALARRAEGTKLPRILWIRTVCRLGCTVRLAPDPQDPIAGPGNRRVLERAPDFIGRGWECGSDRFRMIAYQGSMVPGQRKHENAVNPLVGRHFPRLEDCLSFRVQLTDDPFEARHSRLDLEQNTDAR